MVAQRENENERNQSGMAVLSRMQEIWQEAVLNPTKHSRVMRVRLDELEPFEFQRPLNPKRLAEISREWSPMAKGVPEVSFRAGRLVLLDGNHRVTHGKVMGEIEWDMKVHFGLSFAEECELYYRLDRRTPKPTRNSFDAAVGAGRVIETQVRDMVDAGEWPSKAIGRGVQLAATNGIDHIRSVARVIQATWGSQPRAFDKDIISAVSAQLRVFPEISEKVVISGLQSLTPVQFLAALQDERALDLRRMIKKDGYSGARAIMRRINRNKKSLRMNDDEVQRRINDFYIATKGSGRERIG